jgi:peptide/nickel transport system substrate-binding protein
MNVGYLAMNALRYPFNDTTVVDDPDFGGTTTHGALVRRAFHYAVNRSKIIEEVYDGRAIQAKNPLPPSFWGFNDTVEDYDFDPDHARDILSSLGYTTKGGRSAGFDPITSLIVTVGGFLAIMVVSNRRRRK